MLTLLSILISNQQLLQNPFMYKICTPCVALIDHIGHFSQILPLSTQRKSCLRFPGSNKSRSKHFGVQKLPVNAQWS